MLVGMGCRMTRGVWALVGMLADMSPLVLPWSRTLNIRFVE
jgi:hypothetical protein